MLPTLTGSLALAALVALWGYRDLRVLYASLVSALIVNVRLPVDLLGLPVTTQRLVALVSIGVCTLLFVQGRIRFLRPSPGQLWFTVAYVTVIFFDGLHYLSAPVGATRSNLANGFLNLLLFHLILVILTNLADEDRRSLFDVWLPTIAMMVIIVFVALWVRDMLTLPAIDPWEMRQGYRLRNVGERNIVNIWAASLVLVVALVARPFFALDRAGRFLLSMIALGALSFGIVLTFSRAALFALFAFFATGLALALLDWVPRLWLRGRVSWLQSVSLVLGLVGGITVLVYAVHGLGLPIGRWTFDRVEAVVTGRDASLAERLDRLDSSWQLLDRLPLLGFGPGAPGMERLPENTFMLITLHYGPIAVVCFLVMLGVVSWEVARWWWPRRGEGSAGVLPAALVAYVLLLMSNDFLFFSMGTLTLATITAYCGQDWQSGQRRPSGVAQAPLRSSS